MIIQAEKELKEKGKTADFDSNQEEENQVMKTSSSKKETETERNNSAINAFKAQRKTQEFKDVLQEG